MDKLERILQAGLPEPGDAKEVAGLLSNESLQRVLCAVLSEADAKDTLTSVDLSEGLAPAIERQGEIRGLRRAVDIILEGDEDAG